MNKNSSFNLSYFILKVFRLSRESSFSKFKEEVLSSTRIFSFNRTLKDKTLLEGKTKDFYKLYILLIMVRTQPSSLKGNSKFRKQKDLRNSQKKDIQTLQAGQILELLISSLVKVGKEKVGMAELPTGTIVFIPNGELESTVKVKLLTVSKQYAFAEILEILKKEEVKIPVRLGEILTLTVGKAGPRGAGLVQLPTGYQILIPGAKPADKVEVEITRIKSQYAFAKKTQKTTSLSDAWTPNLPVLESQTNSLKVGARYTVTLPLDIIGKHMSLTSLTKAKDLKLTDREKKSSLLILGKNSSLTLKKDEENKGLNSKKGSSDSIKSFFLLENSRQKDRKNANYVIARIQGQIVFIKLALGAQFGDKVRIQIQKVYGNFAVAKIVEVSPLSKFTKDIYIRTQLRQMCDNSVHFGEKSIRCHANMKKYLWVRRKGQNRNKPYLKKGRHLINVLKTRRCLVQSLKQLSKYALKGRTFLFVGTSKAASGLVARAALLTKTSFFVNTRWLGGMLTNWKTILRSISKIRPILKEKGQILHEILKKRKEIQKRLISRVNELRRKSPFLLLKGKDFMDRVKTQKAEFIQTSQLLIQKREEFLTKGQVRLMKLEQLQNKKLEVEQKVLIYKEKTQELFQKRQNLVDQIQSAHLKLKEFQLLMSIGQELRKIQQKDGIDLLSVSYGSMGQIDSKSNLGLIPQPPRKLLNRMIAIMKQKDEMRSFASVDFVNVNTAKAPGAQGEVWVLSKLLLQFIRFLPFIQTYIKVLSLRIIHAKTLLHKFDEELQKLQNDAVNLLQFQNQLNKEIARVKVQIETITEVIKRLTGQFARLASEQRLLKFLPKLRYLPTPKSKMADTIQILMKTFVDPQLRYPIDAIYDAKLRLSSKKIAASRKKKWQRLEKYFGGITKMAKLNQREISRNVAIIVGQQDEKNAILECRKLGIQMFHIVDTDCNPRWADYFIPANDNSRNSIQFIFEHMLKRIKLAQKLKQRLVQFSAL